jgi:hypothetical protein
MRFLKTALMIDNASNRCQNKNVELRFANFAIRIPVKTLKTRLTSNAFRLPAGRFVVIFDTLPDHQPFSNTIQHRQSHHQLSEELLKGEGESKMQSVNQ